MSCKRAHDFVLMPANFITEQASYLRTLYCCFVCFFGYFYVCDGKTG